jgi:hypothetical protein
MSTNQNIENNEQIIKTNQEKIKNFEKEQYDYAKHYAALVKIGEYSKNGSYSQGNPVEFAQNLLKKEFGEKDLLTITFSVMSNNDFFENFNDLLNAHKQFIQDSIQEQDDAIEKLNTAKSESEEKKQEALDETQSIVEKAPEVVSYQKDFVEGVDERAKDGDLKGILRFMDMMSFRRDQIDQNRDLKDLERTIRKIQKIEYKLNKKIARREKAIDNAMKIHKFFYKGQSFDRTQAKTPRGFERKISNLGIKKAKLEEEKKLLMKRMQERRLRCHKKFNDYGLYYNSTKNKSIKDVFKEENHIDFDDEKIAEKQLAFNAKLKTAGIPFEKDGKNLVDIATTPYDKFGMLEDYMTTIGFPSSITQDENMSQKLLLTKIIEQYNNLSTEQIAYAIQLHNAGITAQEIEDNIFTKDFYSPEVVTNVIERLGKNLENEFDKLQEEAKIAEENVKILEEASERDIADAACDVQGKIEHQTYFITMSDSVPVEVANQFTDLGASFYQTTDCFATDDQDIVAKMHQILQEQQISHKLEIATDYEDVLQNEEIPVEDEEENIEQDSDEVPSVDDDEER